jgi:hypothetical protein
LKVKNIVYLSAIVPKVGQTNVEAMGGEKGVLPMGMEDVVRIYPSPPFLYYRICEVGKSAVIVINMGIARISAPRPRRHGECVRQRHALRTSIRICNRPRAPFVCVVSGTSDPGCVCGCTGELCTLRTGSGGGSGRTEGIYQGVGGREREGGKGGEVAEWTLSELESAGGDGGGVGRVGGGRVGVVRIQWVGVM